MKKQLIFFAAMMLPFCINYTSARSLKIEEPVSEYCDWVFDPDSDGNAMTGSNEDAAKFTWVTLSNGNIKITIAPNDGANYPNVMWRGDGFGTVASVTVDGAGDKFTLTKISDTEIQLVPKLPIESGAIIAYNGNNANYYLLYKTGNSDINGNDPGNISDLYPTAKFIGYTYGTDCNGLVTVLNLAAPTNVNVNGSTIIFDEVANANTYVVHIYLNGTELYSQEISGSNSTLNFPFNGAYTIKVQAKDNHGVYSISHLSNAADWVVNINGVTNLDASIFCQTLKENVLWSWETTAEGNISILVEGYQGRTAAFREQGIRLNSLTIAGIPASAVLAKTSSNIANPQIFAIKAGITIPKGTSITYNGIIEFLENGANQWPNLTFSNYIYGTDCQSASQLETPTDLSLNDADYSLTFTGVTNAASYTIYVYAGENAAYTQSNFTSGDIITYPLAGDYTVKVQAISGTAGILDSEKSEGIALNIPLVDGTISGKSEYCESFFDPIDGNGNATQNDAAYFTWKTAGTNIVVTISVYDTNGHTAFRSNGININNLTVAGLPAANLLTKQEANGIVATQTFIPKTGVKIPKGTAIRYNGFVEYQTVDPDGDATTLDDLYPSIPFNFIYGKNCDETVTLSGGTPTLPATIDGNLIFEAGSEANVDASGSTTVLGTVSVEYTVAKNRWYSVAFPFDIDHVYSEKLNGNLTIYNPTSGGHFYLKTYNGLENEFNYASEIEANIGYIVQFPEYFDQTKVTFVSGINAVTLSNDKKITPSANNYQLHSHGNTTNYSLDQSGGNNYYRYDAEKNEFTLVESGLSLPPFEAVVSVNIPPSNPNQAPRRVIGDGSQAGVVTDIHVAPANDTVIAIKYYNLQGVEIPVGANYHSPAQDGVFIKKTVYQSGAISVSKIIKK